VKQREPDHQRGWLNRVGPGFALSVLLSIAAIPMATARAQSAPGSFKLWDPVPALLNGPRVTTDIATLAAGGRTVQGAAADGVSEIVIALGADSAGERITFQVINDQNQPSTSPALDGGLAQIGSTTFGSNITATAVSTSNGPLAFAIYQAPLDFARPGNTTDPGNSQRAVSISFEAKGGTSGSIPLTIMRPLVVLVHGLWGAPKDWDGFSPLISDSRFSVVRADFSFSVGDGLASTVPSYDVVALARANSLGFAYNAGQVAQQIESFVTTFKMGANPASIPVAAVEADLLGHSMGGNITRTMPLQVGFGSDTTFGQGNVHKLITVDTPHLGSPLAIALLLDSNGCVEDTFAVDELYSFLSVTTEFTNITISGAMGDLQGAGDGTNMSPALQALQPSSTIPLQVPHLIPTAYLAGAMTMSQLDGLNDPPLLVVTIKSICGGDPLANDLTVSGWPMVVGDQSDAIVPLSSQVNNGSAVTQVAAIHSPGTKQLGFLPPDSLEESTGNPTTAINLLNTWVEDKPYVGLR
jgi:pimeloyl-ACP methyl ester carboxylesterase